MTKLHAPINDQIPNSNRDGPSPHGPLGFRHWSSAAFCTLVIGISTPGCVTTTTRSLPTVPSQPTASASRADVTQATASADAGGGPVSADDAVASDASAARLHDIEGTLLMYCALHKRMPPRLEDLLPLADADTDLQVTAPSGRPYLYVPQGLVATGATQRIVVADPAPSPRGSRWCILVPPMPPGARGPLSMEVVAVPEAAFKQYTPAE